MKIFISIIITLIFTELAEAAVKFKGGQISSSSGNLKTEKPAERPDLIFTLSDFDSSHLNLKLSKFDAIRFERRIGIGAPLERVTQWIGLTRRQAIEKTISELEKYSDPIHLPRWVDEVIPVSFIENGLSANDHSCDIPQYRNTIEAAWAKQIIENSTPQFERLALFWLDHFSVAFDTYNQTHSFSKHLEIIRRNTSGNFKDFLMESFYDPGMIVYLNNEQSTAQNPNENLAREFLELFSLGEGNYSENDIKNLSKAISGHGINKVTEQFQLFASKVSQGNRSAFGQNYEDLDGFMKLVSEHPAFGELIARKFYAEYVELNEPSTEDLAYMVTAFRESGFEIKALLKATLRLEKFWDEKNKLTLVKSPIDLVFGTIRTLGTAGNDGKEFRWAVDAVLKLGQPLFNPPNIAGWPVGKDWLYGQSLENRLAKLPFYFSRLDKNSKQAVTNAIISDKKRQRMEKRIRNLSKMSRDFKHELREFFTSGAKEQFLAETMVINWVTEDFKKSEFKDIDVAFYNVSFMGKKWDGISVNFSSDVDTQKTDVNRLSYRQGSSHPAAISNYNDGWVSNWDGHRGWDTSFPSGPQEKFRSKTKEEQLLMKRLLQSMHVPLDNLSSFKHLYREKAAQDWLHERLDEVGLDPIKTERGMEPPVKIFSLPKIVRGSVLKIKIFDCSIRRSGDFLVGSSAYFSEQLSENFDDSKLISTETTPNLSQLLLPALNSQLSNKKALNLLGHEAYQLK